jgi:hypothetical protein
MGGRSTIDLEPYKAQLITWFQDENKTVDKIVQALCQLYNKQVALQTIQHYLKDWNITK